jgi:hypothetical protein
VEINGREDLGFGVVAVQHQFCLIGTFEFQKEDIVDPARG